MKNNMTPELFYSRVLEYAEKTRIGFIDCGRHPEWKTLGLPDTRGFTPHLREVRFYSSQIDLYKKPTTASSKIQGDHRWVIHDLLHILFYDYAALQLGRDFSADLDRFREVHLASEAFAVLSLDYHVLSFLKGQGLAIDCDFDQWPALSKLNLRLPNFLSQEFCVALVQLYLEGESEIFLLKDGTKSQPRAYYENWIGHEIRYAEKQRIYVEMWLQDLLQKNSSLTTPSLHESFVAEPLWELLQILIYASKTQFKKYVDQVNDFLKKDENYFSSFKKYKKLSKEGLIDYRFTDLRAVSLAQLIEQLEMAAAPRAENLFLFWQILSHFDLKQMSSKELKFVEILAASAQTKAVDKKAWKQVQKLCLHKIKELKFPSAPRLKSCFYLP
ncbi:MAG: hypothetical protein AB7F59_08665 [Bdellovibrionales bacterium]